MESLTCSWCGHENVYSEPQEDPVCELCDNSLFGGPLADDALLADEILDED
jgi:ribosomal protein S27E